MKTRKIGLLVVAVMLIGAPSHASEERIAPDFADAFSASWCGSALPTVPTPSAEECRATSTAEADGGFSMRVQAEGSVGELVPAPAASNAWVYLGTGHELQDVSARYLLYSVVLHIDEASASADRPQRGTFGQGGMDIVARAYTYQPTWEKRSSDVQEVRILEVHDPERSAISDREVVIPLLLGDGVRRVHNGWVDVQIEMLAGVQSFGSLAGGAIEARIDARVTSVTVEAIP